MSAAILEPLTVQPMSRLLTLPYERGVEQFLIPIGADGANGTSVRPYDFSEYRARYGNDPAEPKYVLFLKNDVGRDPVTIEVDFSFQGANQTTVFKIPQRSFSNASFAVPLPAHANSSLRLLRFRQRPVPLPGNGADNFGLLALLGNLSKLLWVIGSEKDLIRQHLRDIRQQRQRSHAHDFSLDQLGQDLRVPRFPPREYSFDRDTIALYHLNEAVANGDPVLDETAKFGGAGHPGTNANARSLAIGKFAAGFGFPGPNGDGAITIANHADFDIPAGNDFTAEAFVNIDTSDALIPRVILNKGQLDAAGTLTTAGWSLAIGSFRGITNNIRWSLSDGNPPIDSFADLNIADGKFHHVAGVIDRVARLARLFVDGVQRASADISALGALTNAELIRIGRSATGHSLTGVVDEVRLSRVARAEFQPVLGEGDDAYRRRLGIFERWLLPTHDALQQTINDLVHIDNQPDSFVLIEKDRPSASASKTVRILPALLPAGKSIDRESNSLTHEVAVSGSVNDEPDFNPIFLLNHNRPGVDYDSEANNHLMQLPAKSCLDELVDLLAAANPPIVGSLIVDRAFDPTGGGLHHVGRALLLRHQTLPLDQLGAMVHRAGFDFTQNLGLQIYASVAVGEKLEIFIETPPPAGDVDLFSGQTIRIHLAPENLPAAGQIRWTLIASGSGRAHLQQYEEATLAAAVNAAATTITVASPVGFPGAAPFKIRIESEVLRVTTVVANTWTVVRGVDGTTAAVHAVNAQVTLSDRTPLTTRPRLRLVAEAPGEITLRVEYTFRRQVVSGLRTIRIGIDSLADGLSIASDGRTPVSEESAVGTEREAINPIYLVTSNVAGVNYGADPNNKKMQIVLERAFNSFLATQPGLATGLRVLKAFDPNDTGLHKAGRALRLTHTTVTADRLGALAHRAGFGFVRRQGTEIFCAVAAGEKIEIVRAPGLTPLENELVVGVPVNLRVRLDPLPAGGSYNWSLSATGHGNGSLDFVLRPAVRFTPRTPGLLALNITYLEPDPDRTFPYTFEIRLKPSLEAANAVIPKDQFDLIMNILNFFHPIGVEIVTARIRQHVIEVEQDPQKAFPAYTYPDFRV
jgi:Concanavalin A-like lectin/glucanases superfamily